MGDRFSIILLSYTGIVNSILLYLQSVIMTSGIPVKNYTTARCGHLIFHLDPHNKCMDCRKSKCDFHENCCDLCGSLSDSIIRNLRSLYLKNKRPVHQMSPSPSPSQSRCSSKARNTPIAELISSPKPSKKSKGSKATGKKAAGRVHTSDCTSTANTTATLPTKEVQHVVEYATCCSVKWGYVTYV